MLAQMKMGSGFSTLSRRPLTALATQVTAHLACLGHMKLILWLSDWKQSYWKPPEAAGWLTVWADFILYYSSHSDNWEPGFWKCDPTRVRGRRVLSWEKCDKTQGRRHLNINNIRTSLVGLALCVPAASAGPNRNLTKPKGFLSKT